MSKRFTDTEKWSKAWLRKLPPKFKCAWFYLLDKCDHAGIWPEDFEAMSFNIGEEIEPNEFESIFKGRVIRVDADKFFIMSFVEYQYGNLNPLNKVHRSVMEKLEKIKVHYKGLPRGIQGAKDTDTDKEQDKEKEEEKESDQIPSDILETIKINFGYPDDIIEEVRKDAWLAYQGSTKIDKNWKRFVANFFNHEKEKIRNMIRDKARPPKTNPNGNSEAQAMASKLFDGVIKAGSHELKKYLASLNPAEILAIDKFGRASEILSCTDFQSSEIKTRLKNSCAEAIKESLLRAG